MAFTTAPELNAQKNVFVAAITEGRSAEQPNAFSPASLLPVFTQNFIIVDTEKGPALQNRPSFFLSGANVFSGILSSNVTGTYMESGYLFFSSFNGSQTQAHVIEPVAGIRTVLATVSGDHPVYFESFTNIAGQVIVIWVVGPSNKGGYNLTTLTNTVISTAVIPNTVGAPVFLDGYLFWARSGTNEIYQSNFDDPFNYTAGNFITANIESGIIVNLGKIKNYLVAFKTTCTEFFYNAGNPSGSVLARNDNFFSSVNINGNNYFKYQDSLFFYGGNSVDSRRGLYQLSSTGQMQVYINPAWDRATPLYGSSRGAFGLVQIDGAAYLVCHTTNSFDNRVICGPCYWFDLNKRVFLYQTISPCFSVRRTDFNEEFHVIFNSNSGQLASVSVDPRAELITNTSTPFVAEYQLGDTTHDTLNFKTCNQIKVKLVTRVRPEVTEIIYNDSGVPETQVTRTVYNSNPEPLANRKDVIVRRLGRYRERSYKFRFTYTSALSDSSFKLLGFEFNITIGTL